MNSLPDQMNDSITYLKMEEYATLIYFPIKLITHDKGLFIINNSQVYFLFPSLLWENKK